MIWNSEKILETMTDIADEYIVSAHDFDPDSSKEEGNGSSIRKKRKTNKIYRVMTRRGIVAASVAVVLIGSTVYAGGRLWKQIHITGYDDVGKYVSANKDDDSEESAAILEGVFNEEVLRESGAEAWVDHMIQPGNPVQTLKEGTTSDRWLRKLTENYTSDQDEDGRNCYYEAYDYENLQDAFSDNGIDLHLHDIQTKFPTVDGEYGCDFYYTDASKKYCYTRRFFSGYKDQEGRRVGIEYREDYDEEEKTNYELYEGNVHMNYYTTRDGVEVFLTKTKGTLGGTQVLAEVITEHAELHVSMYGAFLQKEIEEILDSLNIAEGMRLENE